MGDDLGVAVGDEAVSARPEFLSPLDVIKQFAVEDHEDAAVFVGDRLLPIGQTRQYSAGVKRELVRDEPESLLRPGRDATAPAPFVEYSLRARDVVPPDRLCLRCRT